jgi:hypothetical protein
VSVSALKDPRVAMFNRSGGGDDMEPRIAKLEVSVDHINTDIADIKSDIRSLRTETGNVLAVVNAESRRLFQWGVVAIAFILTALTIGYLRLSDQNTQIADKLSQLQVVVARIDERLAVQRALPQAPPKQP